MRCRTTLKLIVVLAAWSAAAQTAHAQSVVLESVTTELEWPIHVTFAPGDSGSPAGVDRIFVIERAGRVRILDDGVLLPGPFLDISDQVEAIGETGLLGIAFHPEYEMSGRFFLFYGAPGPPRTSRIAEYVVSSDPDIADPESGRILLEFPSAGIHAGGWIGFGPDGYLYITTGDSGNPANSQNSSDLRGKVLRIDVDVREPGQTYLIPEDNPYVGVGADEVWAIGLRNPYRAAFDRVTGDFWIGDVGSFVPQRREEVNFVAADSPGGMNFGWPLMEGTQCFAGNCDALVPPVYENPGICAIIGGTVYRGCAIPELEGAYIFGNHCGAVSTLRFVDGQPTSAHIGTGMGLVVGIGEDSGGEVYICTPGELFKLAPSSPHDPDPCDPATVPGDLNGDSSVNIFDLLILLGEWGSCPAPCGADLDGDGMVTVFDLLELLANWG